MNYPDFQIYWLRAFVAVVDAGSLSGAAPLVHRSQSAVSMQIKKLEAALGRPVLLRGPRHLEVTPAGAELLSYARRVLDLQAEAHARIVWPQAGGPGAAGGIVSMSRSWLAVQGRVWREAVCRSVTAS